MPKAIHQIHDGQPLLQICDDECEGMDDPWSYLDGAEDLHATRLS